jgi:hypothetical protein
MLLNETSSELNAIMNDITEFNVIEWYNNELNVEWNGVSSLSSMLLNETFLNSMLY